MTASSPSPCRLNGVGYNNTEAIAGENSTFVGASFQNVGEGTFIPFSAIKCVEGFADGDQFQKSYVSEEGFIRFNTYEYWDGDGWVDPSTSEVIGDDIGFAVGEGAWFVSTEPKQLTFSGEVRKANYIHTFTEPSTVIVSAFPTDFCPNSANVSWACLDGDQMQVPYINEGGYVRFTTYEYWDGDGWVDPTTSEVLDPDFAINTTGKGFWYVTTDPENVSFTEVSPIAE